MQKEKFCLVASPAPIKLIVRPKKADVLLTGLKKKTKLPVLLDFARTWKRQEKGLCLGQGH